MDTKSIIIRNIKVSSPEWLLLKLAEECSELSAAILQFINKDKGFEHIFEEIGDVEISIEHIKELYKEHSKLIKCSKKGKWKKIDKRIFEIENNIFAKTGDYY